MLIILFKLKVEELTTSMAEIVSLRKLDHCANFLIVKMSVIFLMACFSKYLLTISPSGELPCYLSS